MSNAVTLSCGWTGSETYSVHPNDRREMSNMLARNPDVLIAWYETEKGDDMYLIVGPGMKFQKPPLVIKHMIFPPAKLKGFVNPETWQLINTVAAEGDDRMKMYILIKDTVPLGLAMAAIGHGVLACYLKYQADSDMQVWLKDSFKKVICKVNAKEFENAKLYAKSVVMTESALDGEETAIVFCPRPDTDWPKPFNFYQLYSRTVMSVVGS